MNAFFLMLVFLSFFILGEVIRVEMYRGYKNLKCYCNTVDVDNSSKSFIDQIRKEQIVLDLFKLTDHRHRAKLELPAYLYVYITLNMNMKNMKRNGMENNKKKYSK